MRFEIRLSDSKKDYIASGTITVESSRLVLEAALKVGIYMGIQLKFKSIKQYKTIGYI